MSVSPQNSKESLFLLETNRLSLRKPVADDAAAIFQRFACDPEVTRYMSWPRHRSIEDTLAFLAWSDADWNQWPAGSYLVQSRQSGQLIGSTGLSFQSSDRAITGYVFARDAWGKGYATEALQAMVALAKSLGVRRLEASCHADHRPSAHVLEKCGFTCEAVLPAHSIFPNLSREVPQDTLHFVRTF